MNHVYNYSTRPTKPSTHASLLISNKKGFQCQVKRFCTAHWDMVSLASRFVCRVRFLSLICLLCLFTLFKCLCFGFLLVWFKDLQGSFQDYGFLRKVCDFVVFECCSSPPAVPPKKILGALLHCCMAPWGWISGFWAMQHSFPQPQPQHPACPRQAQVRHAATESSTRTANRLQPGCPHTHPQRRPPEASAEVP